MKLPDVPTGWTPTHSVAVLLWVCALLDSPDSQLTQPQVSTVFVKIGEYSDPNGSNDTESVLRTSLTYVHQVRQGGIDALSSMTALHSRYLAGMPYEIKGSILSDMSWVAKAGRTTHPVRAGNLIVILAKEWGIKV